MLRAAVIGGFAVAVLIYQAHIPDPEAVEAGLAESPAGAGWLLAALYATALTVGSAEVLRDNSAQTLPPALVKKPHLKRANARLWGAEVTADGSALIYGATAAQQGSASCLGVFWVQSAGKAL